LNFFLIFIKFSFMKTWTFWKIFLDVHNMFCYVVIILLFYNINRSKNFMGFTIKPIGFCGF
jgi:hypothetical protein